MFHFRPRLLDALRAYDRERFVRDLGAGITVAVVALPLAMAFAIASGLKPEAGLITAVLAGFLISLLGGSRVQIGGPAGAFIVVVHGILDRHGPANLIIATLMSGGLLMAMGLLRLGVLVRFVPVAVVIGFTNGIAVLIMCSQLKEFFGLELDRLPADFLGLWQQLLSHWDTWNPAALAVALLTLWVLVTWPWLLSRFAAGHPIWQRRLSAIPSSLLALTIATLAVAWLDVSVATIGTRFGGIPSALPTWQPPDWGAAAWVEMWPSAMTLAVLGAIESLLCARIADQMIHDRHDANQELLAQGIANVVTPMFGGMAATGTIARTMTNIKQGATSPVAGMVHALTLALIMWWAAPLAVHVPLAALAGILMYVAWNMGEWREFAHSQHFRLPYRVILLTVFVLTVVVDLTVAVEFGLVAAGLTFIYRISSLSRIEEVPPQTLEEVRNRSWRGPVHAYRLYGALFFGAVRLVESLAEPLRSGDVLVIDLKNLIYMDTTGSDALLALRRQCEEKGIHWVLIGLSHQPLDMARRAGLIEAPAAQV